MSFSVLLALAAALDLKAHSKVDGASVDGLRVLVHGKHGKDLRSFREEAGNPATVHAPIFAVKTALTTPAATTAAWTTAAPTTAPCTADDEAGLGEASGHALPSCAEGVADGFCSESVFLDYCCVSCAQAATPGASKGCVDDDAGVKRISDGQLEDCAMGSAMGFCTEQTFSEYCCQVCGGEAAGTTDTPHCLDDSEGVNIATGGQIEDCEVAKEIGGCDDTDPGGFASVCCQTCTGHVDTTTPAPKVTDPALAAVAAAQNLADQKQLEAQLAVAGYRASEEVAEAAQKAATEALHAQQQAEQAARGEAQQAAREEAAREAAREAAIGSAEAFR